MPRSFQAISEYVPAAGGGVDKRTVTGTLTVTLLSLTATTVLPAAMPLTVTTLALTEIVAMPVLPEVAETLPELLLA
ncbi:MAG: hypothetical protein IPM02_21165 [Betaproteobacteria bacterium]|nr:hypothetical protein [Betaproteobacteria bacterium]